MVMGGRYEGPGISPDRADAMVWAMAELMRGIRRGPSVRFL
jgi:phage terminase large subunit-like protein